MKLESETSMPWKSQRVSWRGMRPYVHCCCFFEGICALLLYGDWLNLLHIGLHTLTMF